MVQQGIQSLMTGGQQAPMPGQAPQMPMQGMMPKPSAATPASAVAQLNAQLSSNPEQRLNQLLQMYAQKPTLALLSQVSEATNAVELEKKKQQQDYMTAFAQQGPQTVADMVKQRAQQAAQQPVMAASGGIMQGYSGGGAVAFQYGGPSVGYDRDYMDARRFGINLSPYDAPAVRAEKLERVKKMREFEQQMSANRADIPVDTSKLFPGGPPEVRMPIPEIEVAPAAASRPPGATRPGTGIAQGQNRPQNRPQAAPAAALGQGLGSFVEQTGTPPPDRLSALESADVEAAQKRLTQDPTVKAAQDALLQNMQGTADTRRTRAQQQLDEVLKRGRTNVFEDPEALLRIAAGIDTRRGRGIGSLAGGISGVMGERRKEAADAKTLFNKEMDALGTMEQLRLERDLLIKQGRVTEAQAAEKDLRAVRKDYEGIRYNREVKQAEEARQQFIAESGRMSAGAAQTQAEAAMKSANARVAGAGERGAITQRDLARYRMDAEKQVEKLLPEDREYRKLRNDPTAQAAHRENLIKAKVREALLAAGYEPPAGYERPTTAAAPATNDPLGIRKP
jgi:hypothetical protein